MSETPEKLRGLDFAMKSFMELLQSDKHLRSMLEDRDAILSSGENTLMLRAASEIESLYTQLAEAQAKVKELEGKEIVIGSNVQKLGARLTFMLDDDQWNNIQQLLEAVNEEIADLTAQLEAAKVQGEPVAEFIEHPEGNRWKWMLHELPHVGMKLYTTPPTVQAAMAAFRLKAAEVCLKIGDDNSRIYGSCYPIVAKDTANAILAIPADESALREFGMKVAFDVRTTDKNVSLEAIVDRVIGVNHAT